MGKVFNKILWLIPIGVIGNIVFSWLNTSHEGWEALKSFKIHYLFLAILLGFIQWLTNTARIMIWTRFLGRRFSFRDMLKLVIGSELGSAISPTAIGGGYVKLGMLMTRGLSSGQAASLMTLGTVEDAIFFLLTIPVCIVMFASEKLLSTANVSHQILERIISILPFAGGVLAVLILGKFLLRISVIRSLSPIQKLVSWVNKLIVDFKEVYSLIIIRGKSRLLITIILTAIQYACKYGVLMAILAGFGISFNPFQIFFYQWIIYILTILVPTPGGAGGAETFFYFIYGSFVPHAVLGITTAIWRFLSYYIQLTAGAIIFTFLNMQWSKSKTRRNKNPNFTPTPVLDQVL